MATNRRPPFKIVPIEKVDVFRSLLGQLDTYISESGLRRGDRLGSERELAERFQVSRVSVREALRALESLGKIEIRRNAGSFIVDPAGTSAAQQLKGPAPVDESFLRQLVDVRSAIEAKVVRLVAANPAANLDAVGEVLERAEEELQDSKGAKSSLDLRFEAALGRECGNPLLARFQQLVHELWIDSWSELGVAPGDRRALHAQHKAILAALEGGSGDLAVALMYDHTDRSLDRSESELATPSSRADGGRRRRRSAEPVG